jgi:D-lactate dehydrogenase
MYTEDAHPAKRQMLITEATVDESRYLTEQLASDELVILAIPGTLADANPEMLAQTEILVPFVHSHIGCEQLEKMPKLRYITTRSTGYEHIHLTYAAQRGIVVSHVPGYGESAVAEHTFALLLALSRKLYRALAHERGKGAVMSDLCGMDLFGKTLGVIGTGSIGSRVIQIARGFGMQVLAYDIQRNSQLADMPGVTYIDMPCLLQQADIVTLHVPANPQTYHLLNRETLGWMKPGSLLINTARGALIDSEALLWALHAHILAGAGLDTVEGEELLQYEENMFPLPMQAEECKQLLSYYALYHHPDVIITPHMAFNTREALRCILDITIENIRGYLHARPQHQVRPG